MSMRFSAILLSALGLVSCGSITSSPTSMPTAASVSFVAGARTLTTTAYSPNPLSIALPWQSCVRRDRWGPHGARGRPLRCREDWSFGKGEPCL